MSQYPFSAWFQTNRYLSHCIYMTKQWLIQVCPERAPTSGSAKLLFNQVSSKTTWKWRNFGQGRPLHPQIRNADKILQRLPHLPVWHIHLFQSRKSLLDIKCQNLRILIQIKLWSKYIHPKSHVRIPIVYASEIFNNLFETLRGFYCIHDSASLKNDDALVLYKYSILESCYLA